MLPTLSVVVPCYNEQDVLPEALKRLDDLLHALVKEKLIREDSAAYFVDDGSSDATWSLIASHADRTHRIHGIKLARNFGHQNAMLAGLLSVPGDIVISVDADLQDDLDAIRKMILATNAGADIVFGVRSGRTADTYFKRATAEAYYHLLRLMSASVVFNHADYRSMTRRAIETLRDYREVNLFVRGIVAQLGYKTEVVLYERSERFAGTSKYPLRKMISLALQGITSFSTLPLRWITIAGLLVSLGSFATGIWALAVATISPHAVPGWASTVIPMYLLGGIQMLSLGIIGEYLGKTYLETKRRPRYVIETNTAAASLKSWQSPVLGA